MSYHCEVVTPWVISGNGTIEQAAALAYPAEWSDVTGQSDAHLIPAPNVFVARGQKLTESQMDALEADSKYVVLWSAEEGDLATRSFQGSMTARRAPDSKPTAAEHGKMLSELAKLGVKGQLVAALASSKSRRENANALKNALKELPKA